ncbi:MAG: FKBP-type peptidyl-prolyl cis-trans isomerase [Colwellia sp.]
MARRKEKKTGKGSAGQNRKSSEEFITKYQNKNDVVCCHSGLMYRIVDATEQKNQQPTINDNVEVHQRILLTDGSVIADTYKTNSPEKFSVEEAIDGLTEGLQYMTLGERYEFVIPPELAWGKKGNRSKIGANAVLIIDIRLLAIF